MTARIASKIALVDDDANITASLGMFLEAEGFAVQSYEDGQVALDQLFQNVPDLILLDVKMPRLDGFATLAALKRSGPLLNEVPVIFLTSKADEEDQLAGFEGGADDYVTKPFSHALLLQRIRAVLRRNTARAPGNVVSDLVQRGALVMDEKRQLCFLHDIRVDLTVTEFLLLMALAANPGIVMTREQLIVAAYGADAPADDRLIDSHIKRLRRKFRDVDSDFDHIETLYGAGYRYLA